MFLQEAFLRNSSPPLPKSLIKLSLFFKKSWHHSLIQKLQLVHDGLAFIERISFIQYCCCNPNVQMMETQKRFILLFTQLAVPSNLYWTFSLSKLTPFSHPKNALVFLSAEGWGARFFLIESIGSAATLWSCSKWKATEIWCLNVERLRKWH